MRSRRNSVEYKHYRNYGTIFSLLLLFWQAESTEPNWTNTEPIKAHKWCSELLNQSGYCTNYLTKLRWPGNAKSKETWRLRGNTPHKTWGQTHLPLELVHPRQLTPDVTPTDDFKIKEIQSFEKYMEMAVLPVVKTDTSVEQLNAWLDQTVPTNP